MNDKLAEKNNVPIAKEILADILAKSTLKSDQIHPNSQGYQLLAEKTTVPVEWVKGSRVITAEEAYKHNLATHYITF